MKQIVCAQPGRLMTVDAPMPSAGPREAIIRIQCVGICGTDMHAYHGNQPYFTYPRVLGHELSGIIESFGMGDHDGFEVGDRVTVIPYLHCGRCGACRRGRTNCCVQMQVMGVHRDGGMAEFLAVPISHLMTIGKLGLEQGAVIEPLAIGEHAVSRAGIAAADTVAVVGAGPIGLGVMVMARRRGARVFAVDISEERLDFCRRWAKVEAVVDARQEPMEALAMLTDGEYPLFVFDATGNAKSMAASVQYAAHGGTLVYVGLVKGDVSLPDSEFHKRELSLLGSRNATGEDFAAVHSALEEGAIDVGQYVTHRIADHEVVAAFSGLTQPEAGVIKAVVEWGEG